MADVVDYTFARVWRMPSTTHLLGCQAQGSSLTLRIGNASGKFRNCIVVGNANQNGPSGVGGDYVSKATYTLCDVAGLTGAGCKTETDPANDINSRPQGWAALRRGRHRSGCQPLSCHPPMSSVRPSSASRPP